MSCRILLMLALLLAGGRVPALDCGDASLPCTTASGAYHIALPADWQGGAAVMHLHGFGGSGAKVIARDSLVTPFTSRGYAVIAPTALPWAEGEPNDWAVRDGWVAYPRRDIPFLREVLADAAARADVDPERLLLTGFSRGGSMVWDVACHAPDFAAAYAPASGGFFEPVPRACHGAANILHVHGFADPIVPMEGHTWRNDAYQFTISQADIWEGLHLWRRENRCPNKAAEHDISDGMWRKRWACENGSLELVLHEGKHSLPAGWADTVLDWFEGLDR